ncbi:MAG TPA: hypothetical protein VF503_14520 [Sphingobium sp.]|uniref:hypothetical protein n=1 Tax=Sphingobium sp. TaxID=1912891 RepID=UPI002ECFAE8F
MNNSLYEIRWEPAVATLIMKLSGFWNDAVYTDFSYELTRVTEGIPGRYSVLLDIGGSLVQSAETIAGHEQLLAKHRANVERMAIIGSGAITRMQAKRATNVVETCFFPNEADARSWIKESREGA